MVSAAAALLTLAVFEAGARIYLSRFADEDAFRRYASFAQLRAAPGKKPLYSPHRYLGYYPTPGYRSSGNRHNALGYRGEEIELPKPPGTFRIVCLGGSTTYSGGVGSYLKSYPDRLEASLRQRGYAHAEVINAGAGGWSSWESLINFQLRVLDLEPDLIIVYHGINDVHPRLVWPPATYRGDNSGRRAPNPSLLAPGLIEHSTFFRMLLIRGGWILPHSTFERTIDSPAETYHGDLFRRQKLDDTYPSGIFEQISAEQMLAANPPTYFERNVRNIVATARRWGVVPVLASFAYSQRFPQWPRVSSEEYVQALEETNEVIRRIGADPDVHFFDFAAVFPDDPSYFTDGRHLTAAGNQLKGELFADYLIDRRLIPGTAGEPATAAVPTDQ